ncbi:glycosyltransferase family 4 protein [Hydrogenimonas urashimensis]|uniref:glycosyltransferase family 4 protein n=1 Tax=Hydrogenimonas urashimensis TaxID=2740515 RepID=UPI001916AB99|nr:glycosyltransferase family 4 protein [Hydrogenimonas urashimensis]
MRILHTEWIRTKGGQSMRVLEDLKIIEELGHTPYLACRKESWLYEEARRRGFETFALPFGHLADPKPYLEMVRLIQHLRVEIVHTHSSKDSYPATYAAKLLGIKTVRSRHIELTKKPGHLFRLADRIVTTGERIKEELLDCGLSEKKVVSIPTYPDPRRFVPSIDRRRAFRHNLTIGTDTVVIGTMAGAGNRKRGWALVDMMPAILQTRPETVLLIAGDSRGDAAERLQARIDALGLQNRVRFVGYVQPETFLDAVDIYACPSEKEGLPQALMQAMMMGKACLSTDVGSIPELNAEENLLLTDKEDLAGFATLLQNLAGDRDRIRRLGETNRRLALERFNRDVMKAKSDRLYRELAEGVKRG